MTFVDGTTAPIVAVDTVDGYAASLAGSLDMELTLVLGFLGLAVMIAVLGIATTIGLSVHRHGFASPVVLIGTLVAVTIVAGAIAAALPARRAPRLAVLDAVRTA